MNTTTLLIDSNVWSHWLLGSSAIRGQVQEQLATLRRKYGLPRLAISRLSMIEMQVGCLTQQPTPAAREQSWLEFEQLLTDLRIEIVEIDAVIGETSAKWRAESIERVKAGLTAKNQVPTTALSSKLKTLDALIAASCMKFDPPAVLFTQNVKDFEFTVKGKKQNLGGLTVESLKLAK